jgi:DNA-binding NarL/FixJ family response regulator
VVQAGAARVRPPGSLTPRNRLIIQQRAAGRTVQSIAAEHGLSPARVSVICRDHALSIRVAELEAEVARLTRELRTAVAQEMVHGPRSVVDLAAVDRQIAQMVGRPTREDLFTTG